MEQEGSPDEHCGRAGAKQRALLRGFQWKAGYLELFGPRGETMEEEVFPESAISEHMPYSSLCSAAPSEQQAAWSCLGRKGRFWERRCGSRVAF
jgi:hypothetical protein